MARSIVAVRTFAPNAHPKTAPPLAASSGFYAPHSIRGLPRLSWKNSITAVNYSRQRHIIISLRIHGTDSLASSVCKTAVVRNLLITKGMVIVLTESSPSPEPMEKRILPRLKFWYQPWAKTQFLCIDQITRVRIIHKHSYAPQVGVISSGKTRILRAT